MSNKAAWLKSEKATPLVVDDAPMPKPEPYQVVINVQAVAINPVDSNIQKLGFLVQKYPAIIGCDAAGTVHAVGSEVKHLKVGDRVLACNDFGGPAGEDQTADTLGAFQHFAITHHKLVAKIPDSITFKDAAVLPIALATAATAMYDKRCMGLTLPTATPTPQRATLVVWGGASSVGAVGIMLGLGSGFEVITTSSAGNFDFCKSIGAKAVFDYKSESVVDDIVAYLDGKQGAGVFNAIITPESSTLCYQIAHRSTGHKHVGTVMPPGWEFPKDKPEDVETSENYCTWVKDNEVGDAVFVDWVPKALASGVLQCKPPARVVGQGLEHIQTAIDAWAAGVSAEKIVVETPH